MKEKILEILQDIRPEVDFNDSEDFIEDGYLDSFDMANLIAHIEDKFGISILGEDILPENFTNLETIERTIKKYQ